MLSDMEVDSKELFGTNGKILNFVMTWTNELFNVRSANVAIMCFKLNLSICTVHPKIGTLISLFEN